MKLLLYMRIFTILSAGDTMIVRVEQDLTKKEIEVIIKHSNNDREVERIVSLIQSADRRINCDVNGTEKLVNISDIYYIESVDKKTFIYCEKAVFHTDLRLCQLLEILINLDFVQISKSCILNLNMLDSFKPLLNSRMEATLKNGERLFVTRKYLAKIKQELQKGILT